MNYFLHYDNLKPLFVGGHAHGKRYHVDSDRRYWNVPIERPLELRVARFEEDDWKTPYATHETFRAIRFCADGREFRVMVHESLNASAAQMLLFQSAEEGRVAMERVVELERENRALKKLLGMLTP